MLNFLPQYPKTTISLTNFLDLKLRTSFQLNLIGNMRARRWYKDKDRQIDKGTRIQNTKGTRQTDR